MTYEIERVENGYVLTIQAEATELAKRLVFRDLDGVFGEIERREQA